MGEYSGGIFPSTWPALRLPTARLTFVPTRERRADECQLRFSSTFLFYVHHCMYDCWSWTAGHGLMGIRSTSPRLHHVQRQLLCRTINSRYWTLQYWTINSRQPGPTLRHESKDHLEPPTASKGVSGRIFEIRGSRHHSALQVRTQVMISRHCHFLLAIVIPRPCWCRALVDQMLTRPLPAPVSITATLPPSSNHDANDANPPPSNTTSSRHSLRKGHQTLESTKTNFCQVAPTAETGTKQVA